MRCVRCSKVRLRFFECVVEKACIFGVCSIDRKWMDVDLYQANGGGGWDASTQTEEREKRTHTNHKVQGIKHISNRWCRVMRFARRVFEFTIHNEKNK